MEYSHTINLFYPSGISFSFAVTQGSFADSYLIMEIFGLASKMTPSSAAISDNDVSEPAKFHLITNQSLHFRINGNLHALSRLLWIFTWQ